MEYQCELFISDKVSGELKELYTKFRLLDFGKTNFGLYRTISVMTLGSKVR